MSESPVVAWRNPKREEQWGCYIDGVIAVRRLNSGRVQIKVSDGDWKDAE
jgi:hypothetical protein